MKGITSWFSPKVYVSTSAIEGKGLHCRVKIFKDETIAIKGGHIMDAETFYALPDNCKHAALQIADSLFLAPIETEEIPRVMNYVNHSCSPNVGLRGQLATVAMREIEPGEELTGDYCIAYSNNFFQFDCHCGSVQCRNKVTSEDWKLPILQKRYKGYFCQYVQDKINTV
jgi:SET domain-containing protein